MKHIILFSMLISLLCFSEEQKVLYRNYSRYKDGMVYYSHRSVDGVVMKTVKLEWSKFSALYPKSWTFSKETGWVMVDTPKDEKKEEKEQATIPRYIPPIRNFSRGRIVENPTISAGPSKK